MLTIILDKGQFYPGNKIKGNVEFVPDTEIYINDIELCFFYLENWNHSISDEKEDTCNYKQCLSLFDIGVKKYLPEGDNNLIRLDPILHLFPFELELPDFLFPSFEYPKHDYRSFLRYSLIAKLKSPYLQLSASKIFFIYSISGKDNNSCTIENTFNIKKWGMFGKGITNLKVFLPMKSYRFADDIPIKIDIDNTNGKMKVILVKINLIRKVILKDNKNDFKEKYSTTDKVYKKVYKVSVNSGAKEVFNFKFPLNDIRNDEFSFYDNVNLYNWGRKNSEFMPSIESNIISCQYFIKVTLYYDGFIKKANRPRTIIPISIIHILNNNYNSNTLNPVSNISNNVEESNAEEIRKQKNDDFVIINNNNSINQKSTPNDFNKSKTLNNNNTYIGNMISNNNNLNNINNNNNEFNVKPLSNLNNNKNYDNKINIEEDQKNVIQNNNDVIENQDDAPSCILGGSNEKSMNMINESENKINNNEQKNNFKNINEFD
jgi:hypothetical protein